MKFKFRLDTVLRSKKANQDIAQRAHGVAAENVRVQMRLIQSLYKSIDVAREKIEVVEVKGGNCAQEISSINDFINSQKIRIEREKNAARSLMAIEEEKLEDLVIKAREVKVIEKLKEKKKDEFKKKLKIKQEKEIQDIVTMRYNHKVGL